MRGYVLHSLAEADLIDSAQFYDRKVKGLGEDFLDEVFSLIQRLIDHPESAPLITKRVRVARVNRFPYDVLFKVETDHIFVLAIGHQSRKPGFWKKRL